MIIHPAPSEIKEVFRKMTEIEKMQKYIERTKTGIAIDSQYQMNVQEAVAASSLSPLEAVSLAFRYGKAKGYRAAKAEVRA